MTKVISFPTSKSTTHKKANATPRKTFSGGYSFEAEVDENIDRLAEATGKTRDEAVQIATDFYRRYPMLMEFVRSPEHLLRK